MRRTHFAYLWSNDAASRHLNMAADDSDYGRFYDFFFGVCVVEP